MPRITSVLPGAVVGVNLDHFAWKLLIGTVLWGRTPCVGVLFSYETQAPYLDAGPGMSPIDITPALRVSLLRAPVAFADEIGDIAPVAKASTEGGTLEKDLIRMKEAFELFKNAKVRAETIEQAVKDVTELLGVYWALADWIMAGATERIEVAALGTRLVGSP